MRSEIGRLFFILLVFLSATGRTEDAGTKNAAAYLSATIAIDETSLKTDFYRKAGQFYVNTIIRNTGEQEQKITIWTNQAWSWLTNNPQAGLNTAAAKNAPSTIMLRANQEYSGKVLMFDGRQDRTKPLTFRMGFYPEAETPVSDAIIRPGNAELAWSNSVKLNRE